MWIRFGGKDRPGFVWKQRTDLKERKAKKYIQKKKRKEKKKDDKNDNKNEMAICNRLGWIKEKSPARHNLDGFKHYNFTNCIVTLSK